MGNTGITWSDNGGDGSHLDYKIGMYNDVSDTWVMLNPTQIISYTGGDLDD
jgi:hypothetical protein